MLPSHFKYDIPLEYIPLVSLKKPMKCWEDWPPNISAISLVFRLGSTKELIALLDGICFYNIHTVVNFIYLNHNAGVFNLSKGENGKAPVGYLSGLGFLIPFAGFSLTRSFFSEILHILHSN